LRTPRRRRIDRKGAPAPLFHERVPNIAPRIFHISPRLFAFRSGLIRSQNVRTSHGMRDQAFHFAREIWCCRGVSNSGPPPYQGGALPLSYGSERWRVGNTLRTPRLARQAARPSVAPCARPHAAGPRPNERHRGLQSAGSRNLAPLRHVPLRVAPRRRESREQTMTLGDPIAHISRSDGDNQSSTASPDAYKGVDDARARPS
jgi:hypothetical protein